MGLVKKIIIALLLMQSVAYSQAITKRLIVQEVDGDPAAAPFILKFDNGSLTHSGAVMTHSINGFIGANSSDTQILFNNSGVIAGSSDLTWDYTNKMLGVGLTTPLYTIHGSDTGLGAVKIAGNTSLGSRYVDAFCILEASTSARGRGVLLPDRALSNTWFAGRPYNNESYIIGYTAGNATTELATGSYVVGNGTFFQVESDGTVNLPQDNQQLTMGADRETDYYQKFNGTNAVFYTSGIFNFKQGTDGQNYGSGTPPTGLSVLGYDDKVSSYLNMSVDQYGYSAFTGSSNIYFSPAETMVMYLSATNGLGITTGKCISFGGNADALTIKANRSQGGNTLFLGVNDTAFSTYDITRAVIVCDKTDTGVNFNYGAQSNPTLYVHSANATVNEYVSFTHDQTDGVIDVGTGGLRIGTADSVQLQMGASGATDYYQTFDGTNTLINTSGILKLQPAASGDVSLFYDGDIAGASDGKIFYVYRNSTDDGTRSAIGWYIDADRYAVMAVGECVGTSLRGNGTWVQQTDAGNDMYFLAGGTWYFSDLDDSSATRLSIATATGDTRFYGDIGVGGVPVADYPLSAYQTADGKGLVTYGFDDQSGVVAQMYVDGSGYALFDTNGSSVLKATGTCAMQSTGSTIYFVSTDGYTWYDAPSTVHMTLNGSGVLNVLGGFSDNGSAGVDGTFDDKDGNTITVSGGIITSLGT